MQFDIVDTPVDRNAQLLYLWEIFDHDGDRVYHYVGKSKNAERPLTNYKQNVENLLAGRPYREENPDGFREVHHKMAEAVKLGHRIVLTLLRNVPPEEDFFEAERDAARQHGLLPGSNDAGKRPVRNRTVAPPEPEPAPETEPAKRAPAARPKPPGPPKGRRVASLVLVAVVAFACGWALGAFGWHPRGANDSGDPLPPVGDAPKGATIAADPNPVPAGAARRGSTTITWDTGDNSLGDVYFSVNNGPEKKWFGARAKGSQEASWINKGGVYEFRLYASGNRDKILASVRVAAQ
jgi:hypothetical protein